MQAAVMMMYVEEEEMIRFMEEMVMIDSLVTLFCVRVKEILERIGSLVAQGMIY
jgi:hypothetical protein